MNSVAQRHRPGTRPGFGDLDKEPSNESSKRTQYESSKTYPYPRGLAGPEIVDFGGLNGPSYRKAPHLFQWVLR